MVANLPGYLLNEYLYEGINTSIYRVRSQFDFSTFIIKTTKAEYPTLEEITSLRHEYTILQTLADVKGIVKVHGLEKYGNSLALILEDFWGISFQQLLTLGKLPVLTFLSIAIQLAEILHGIHTRQIIHQDINPQNILLEPESLTVKLIDFSIAAQLSKENPCISHSQKLEGSLAYISPEQTATTNQSVDYRTDFYALGVTFYEMLTGQLPFTTTDALELINCHINKNPVPPHEVDSEIPQPVSDIVLKLMAKNVEDRYQNALVLKADLETCLYQLQSQGKITQLNLGELDKLSQFQIPQIFYKRLQKLRQPLKFEYIYELTCDILNVKLTDKNDEKIRELVQIIYHKTQGNPLLVTQLLETIHTEGLLQFNFANRQWQWEIQQIQALEFIDNQVVELAVKTLYELPDATQQVLQLAACIGNQFSLNNLAIANKSSVEDTAAVLWDALQSNVILPVLQTEKVTYKFLCDRVQQAAYSLIPNDQKQKTHLSIGRLLLQKTPDSALESNIFDIVNQLNLARDLITQTTDKEHIAALNLIAGTKAKQLTAYETAVKYVNLALKLLPKTAWYTNYDLALNLHIAAIETEYIYKNYKRVQQLSEIVLAKAKKPLDKIKVYETKIQYFLAHNQHLDAVNTALAALTMLGISLPKETGQLNILGNSLVTKMLVNAKGIDNLAQLPGMTDPYKIAAMRVLISILLPAYLKSPNLFPLVIFKMINLSVRFGNSAQAAYGYVLYGWLLCGALGDIKSGYKFGQLAMKLLENFDSPELQCKVINLYNTFIRHWHEHAKETISAFVDALQISLAANDIEYAGYSIINYCQYTFLLGEHLDNVRNYQKPYIELMQQLKQENVIHAINIVRQTAANLADESANPYYLNGDEFQKAEITPAFQGVNSNNLLFMNYSYKAMLLYLFKEYDQSVENAELAERYAASCLGCMTLAAHNFYYSLALLASYANYQHPDEQKQILKKIDNNQNKMRNWAAHAPENYQHKYELIAAEKARVLGNNLKAIAHYKAAIQGAVKHGYIQEEALINELVAEFYFAYNQVAIAEVYLIKSYYGYIRWGAKAKVKNLASRYPGFFSRILHRNNPKFNRTVINHL